MCSITNSLSALQNDRNTGNWNSKLSICIICILSSKFLFCSLRFRLLHMANVETATTNIPIPGRMVESSMALSRRSDLSQSSFAALAAAPLSIFMARPFKLQRYVFLAEKYGAVANHWRNSWASHLQMKGFPSIRI